MNKYLNFLLWVLYSEKSNDRLYIPSNIGKIIFYEELPNSVVVHLNLIWVSIEGIEVDASIYNSEGKLLIKLTSVYLIGIKNPWSSINLSTKLYEFTSNKIIKDTIIKKTVYDSNTLIINSKYSDSDLFSFKVRVIFRILSLDKFLFPLITRCIKLGVLKPALLAK